MNAYCTYDDDPTCYDFAEPGGASGSACDDDFDLGHVESAEALAHYGFGPDLDDLEAESQDFGDDEWHFEDADAVERHAMRRATVASTLAAVADRVGETATATATATEAVALLTWSAAHLGASSRQRLADQIRTAGSDDAGTVLALWRGGALERDQLRRAARGFLDATRVQLAVETHEDTRVIEGPWRRDTPSVERTHQLHVLFLALRHGGLQLDEVDEQVAELWQEELRSELNARQRETRNRALEPSEGEEHFSQSVRLVAAAAEMWRDTAPAARPVRLPLEKLTRLLWHAARQRKVQRVERAELLIAAGNQRLDDLPAKQMEAGLYADDDADSDRAVQLLTATWVGGRRPSFAPAAVELDLATEALVIRALSGPSRTGPRRS